MSGWATILRRWAEWIFDGWLLRRIAASRRDGSDNGLVWENTGRRRANQAAYRGAVRPAGSRGSGCLALIVPEQPAQPLATTYAPGGTAGLHGRRISRHADRPVAQTLMRPELVVIHAVRLHDVIQLPQAEAEEVVQALPLEA